MALVLGVLVPSQGRAAPTLRMRVSVYPNPMRSDTRAESITVLTQPRIICVAFVLYDNGTIPLTFEHAETEVTSARGVATWGWHETSAASGGTASVSCNNGVTTRTVNAHFRVVPAAAPRPTAHPATRGALTVRVIVTPQPWPHRATRATVVAYTIPGAVCAAGLFTFKGRVPPSFVGLPRTAIARPLAWHWHPRVADGGGTATVTCRFRGKIATASAVYMAGT